MKKCPVCGHENNDDVLFCHDCGEPLGEEITEKRPAFEAEGFDTDTDDDDTIFGGKGESFDDDEEDTGADDESPEEFGFGEGDTKVPEDTAQSDDAERREERGEDEPEEDDDVTIFEPELLTKGGTGVSEEEQSENADDAEEEDNTEADVHEQTKADEADKADEPQQERYVSKKRGGKNGKADDDASADNVRHGSVASDIAFVLITILLTCVVVFLSVLFVKQNYPGETLKEKLHYIMTSSFTDNLITKAPTIEPDQTSDGEKAIRITVYARRGAYVAFREGATYMERQVEGQSIAFRVPTSLWTANVKGEALESIDITPNVFVYDPAVSNEVVQLEFKPYKASLEAVEITLISPSVDVFTTSSTSVPIEGRVSDNSVAVFMNGTQLQLDEDGYFRTVYYITGDKSVEQEVVFTAQKSGYSIGKKVLVINYNKSNISLEITNESLRTFENTIEITGKVDKGVELSVKGVEVDGEIEMKKNGSFKFIALVPGVGNYAVTFNLKDKNGESSTVIYVEHAPNKDDFISSTSTFDYDWLVEHPTLDKKFGISGSVVEVYQTEPYVRAKLHTSSGDIIFVYYHTTEVSADDNKSYRIYCVPDGTDAETGLPQVYCWFIYKS